MKRTISIIFIVFICVLVGMGCVERRYYVVHHEHSPRYYHRHPHRHPVVDVEIHN